MLKKLKLFNKFVRRELDILYTEIWWSFNSTSRKIIKKRFDFFLYQFFFIYPYRFLIFSFFLFILIFFYYDFFCLSFWFILFSDIFSILIIYYIYILFKFLFLIFLDKNFIIEIFFYLYFFLKFNYIFLFFYLLLFYFSLKELKFYIFYLLFFFFYYLNIYLFFLKLYFYLKFFILFFFNLIIVLLSIVVNYLKKNKINKKLEINFNNMFLNFILKNFLANEKSFLKDYNYIYIKKYLLKDEIFFQYDICFNKVIEKNFFDSFFFEFFNLYNNLKIFKEKAIELKTDEYIKSKKKYIKYKRFFKNFLYLYIKFRVFFKLLIIEVFYIFFRNLYYFLKFMFNLGKFLNKRKIHKFKIYFVLWGWDPDLVDPLDFKNWRQTYTYKKVYYFINFYDIKGFFFYIYVHYSLIFLTEFFRILHFIYWESFFLLVRNMTGPLYSPFEKKIISWYNWFVAILWTNPIKERNYYKLKFKSFMYFFVYLDIFEFFFNFKNFIYYFFFYKNKYFYIIVNFYFFFLIF